MLLHKLTGSSTGRISSLPQVNSLNVRVYLPLVPLDNTVVFYAAVFADPLLGH